MSTPALHLRRAVKSFNGRLVLDVDELTVERGEIHALLGQNGSGKSTLIKILSGFHDVDSGTDLSVSVAGVEVAAGSRVPIRATGLRFVHQDLGLISQMSVADNLHLDGTFPTRRGTVRARQVRDDARGALARVGMADVDPATPIARLSPAERTGVAVARALATTGDEATSVLVLDEPTATLPAREAERLLTTLVGVAASGVAILYVTHHLEEVFAIADRVSVLRDGVTVASAPTAELTRNEVVHHLVGSDVVDIHRPTSSSARGGAPRSTEPSLEVEDLVGDFIDGLSFTVYAGEIVGIHGVSGSGRDSVLGTVFGARGRISGTVRVAGVVLPPARPDESIHRGVGFVPADRKAHGGLLTLRARENLTLPALRQFWSRGRIRVAPEAEETRTWFSRLEVRPQDGIDLPLSSFSGGNQQKIILAKWLRQQPAVLLLDEPTQGVDIGAKATLHRTILDAARDGLAIVVATSDHEEMAALCTKVHIVQRGRIVDTLSGDEITHAELGRRLTHPGVQLSMDRNLT